MNQTHCWVRREDLQWRDEGGKVVITDDAEGKIYTLSETAAVVWRALDGTVDAEHAVIRVSEMFEGKLEQIRKDVTKLLKQFDQMDLITRKES